MSEKELQQQRKKLIQRLRENMCMFTYIKKSTGEKRTALGTLNPENYLYDFKGGNAWYDAPYLVRYWDITKNGWRSCDFRNIVEIHW